MKMRKKIAGALAACLCAATVSAGCGNKASSADGSGVKILLALSEIDTFRQTFVDAAQKAASERGAVLDVADAQGVIENQVEQMRQAAGSYDAVLCVPIDVDTARELKESAGDLPVIFCNSCPKEKYLSAEKYLYVGSDEDTAGEYQAQYILDALSAKEEINVVLLKGPSEHSATVGRTAGLKKALAESGKKINYVFEDHADWSQEWAMELFEIFLKTGNPVDCVICNNDSMAIGVADACEKAGIDPGSLPILGVDATVDGCAAIADGKMAFTVYQSGAGQGQAAVETAIALATGSSAKGLDGISEDGMYVWVPFEKVDKGNVGQYME